MQIFALSTFALTTMAAEPIDLDEHFDLAAESVTYAQLCQDLGYSIDRKAVRRMSLVVQQEAIKSGVTRQQAGDRMRQLIRLKMRRLNRQLSHASAIDEGSGEQRRFYRNWNENCERLFGERTRVPDEEQSP